MSYKTKYFLGANSPSGFHSLYDGFVSSRDGDFLWVIKGGPGSGKSSFMKRIGAAAEKRGLDVEYIYCSAAPDSLDGVYIPAHKTAYVDGTHPHVIESDIHGASSMYLDLGRFSDSEALRDKEPVLRKMGERYKRLYKRAYGAIAAAAEVAPDKLPELVTEEDIYAVRRRAAGAILRELGKTPAGGAVKSAERIKRRFLSALTCDGPMFMDETVKTLCPRLYTLDNDCGCAKFYLEEIEKAVVDRGLNAVLCPDPMNPGTLEAVLLPEQGLGFLAITTRKDNKSISDSEVYRHVRLDALLGSMKNRETRPRYRAASRLHQSLLADAHGFLFEAKALHDEIEAVYNPFVDFKGLYALCEEHIKRLF